MCRSLGWRAPTNLKPILYYVPTLELGGAETQLLHLAAGLDRRQFEPHVWYTGRWGPAGDRMREAGVALHHRAFDSTLTPWIRELRPAVLDSVSYLHTDADVGYARMAGVRLVLTRRANMRHWDPARKLRPWERERNRLTDVVVANCEAAAALCREVEEVPPERLRVIPSGVPAVRRKPARTIREELGLGRETLLLGNVANLKKVKDQATLMKAFRTLSQRFGNLHLVIAGDGPERETLRRLSLRLGIRRQVSFPGVREDVASVYGGLDVYVHSSLSEGLSSAVLEAMAFGLPVAATAVGGTGEAVIDGETGLLVPPGDSATMAEAITRILTSPALQRKLGRAAREHVRRCFSQERMILEYQRLYACG